ncbi:MAG: peptidase S1 [Burkholderiales bacterium 70-64]|nr:MAG: peptidase S1 [Burkholderiales bacterium 70-64]
MPLYSSAGAARAAHDSTTRAAARTDAHAAPGASSGAAPDAAPRGGAGAAAAAPGTAGGKAAGAATRPAARWRERFGAWRRRRGRAVLGGAIVALALATLGMQAFLAPHAQRALTQDDIDAAVLHTLQTRTLPSPAAKAWEVIRPSVVRVRGLEAAKRGEADTERNVGTGVVILDTGTILTNLHVVADAPRIRVEFADGSESDASVIGLQPDQDLAVLQARTVPDDLVPATLRSTADLAVGDRVVAVGFPFGIGPSATAGIVSGLRREFRSPEGKRVITNLIQFDAAANPGNSGGPLVTADGEVVGIVTAIMNPTEQRVFVGIGFAVPIETAAAAVGSSPF